MRVARLRAGSILLAAAALAILTCAASSRASGAASSAAPVDMWGRPVLGEDGERRNYGPTHDMGAASRPDRAVVETSSAAGQPAPSNALAAWPLDVRLEFRAASFGTGIGEAGIAAADLDGDGALEIVAAAFGGGYGPATYWYVLERQGARYRQTWVSAQYASSIGSLAVGAVDADPAPEIVIGTGSEVRVHDGLTRELEGVIPTSAPSVAGLQVVDVDSDGAPEVVFCSPGGLYVYDARTGAPEVEGISEGCSSVAVGNVDGDAALEMVLGNGTATGYVVDGITHAPEWAWPQGFGVLVRVGDVDGDGISEIVAAYSWQKLSVLDAVGKYEQDSLTTSHDIGGLEVVDVEGDGPVEVVWGDGQWGSIHVLSGGTLDEKWAVANPEHGVTNILIADTDDDGVRELLWGAGHTSSGPDYLYVVDTVTRQVEWRSIDFNGPFYGLAHGDVEANGKPDFLLTSFASDSGYGDGLYFVYGAIAKRLRYVSPEPTGRDWSGLVRIQVANLDADPQLEVLVGTSDLYRGVLICYDGLTHAEQWRALVDDGLSIWALQVADVDADGRLEAVIGTIRQHTGAPGLFLYVVDAATGFREWRSPDVEPSWGPLSLLRVAQVDADPAPEILVAEHAGSLSMFDGVTHARSVLVDTGVTALETVPRRPGGRSDVVVGTADGRLFRLRVGRRAPEPLGSYGASIDGLAVRDLTGDGIADYVFAVEGEVWIVHGRTGAVLWRSERLDGQSFPPAVGVHDSLLVADVDLDGRQEILVNTGRVGVDIYEIPAP